MRKRTVAKVDSIGLVVTKVTKGPGSRAAEIAMAYKLIDALYLPRALSARANASSTVPTASTAFSSAL